MIGLQFKKLQQDKATIQRYVDRAAQASGTKQKVLTDYGTRISDLVINNNLKQLPLISPIDENRIDEIRNVARGEKLIALRRLDDKVEIEQSVDLPKEKIAQLKDVLRKYNDAGELKGLLVRFLYESELLIGVDPIVNLSGANITRVNLNYAPLPDIDLKGAWLTWGKFLNADLRRANLSDRFLLR